VLVVAIEFFHSNKTKQVNVIMSHSSTESVSCALCAAAATVLRSSLLSILNEVTMDLNSISLARLLQLPRQVVYKNIAVSRIASFSSTLMRSNGENYK